MKATHHIRVNGQPWCETTVGPPLLDILEVARKRHLALTCDHLNHTTAKDMQGVLQRFLANDDVQVVEGPCPSVPLFLDLI